MGSVPRLGAAYYPEQWPRERWDIDAQLMRDAGLSVVRVAEFAWSRLEPSPGTYELDWLDEAVGVLADAGLDVILGTPTAAPPPWLIARHPEILPVRGDGRVQEFGNRRHYCPNQPTYQSASAAVVTAMAERFGSDDRVMAWQIDNELGGRCYCDACAEGFQAWLRSRYDTLDVLNEVWGTVFWSQVYDDWSQIHLPDGSPVPMPSAFGFGRNPPNPGLALDYRRFMSDSLIGFLKLQTEILRARCDPRQPITHNLMGFGFSEIDYFALAEEIDVVSWDNYPILDTSKRWTKPALAGDAMRGLKSAPVWVLEQQVGPLGWELVRTPQRGETRLLAWQAIAHGAEIVSFFRWRTARYGTEQHWHGIIDADGRVGRRYEDVRELASEIAEVADRLADAQPSADVALLHDYDARFALQIQPTNPALLYEQTVHTHYEALRGLGLGVDVVGIRSDLGRYRVVAAPALYVMDEGTAATLTQYVESGGMLVLAPRAGVKDRCNAIPERPLPAWLDELVGARVVDYMSLEPDAAASLTGAVEGAVHGWYEELDVGDATTVASYMDGPFAGSAAITRRHVGAGVVVYVAGVADEPTLRSLYRLLGDELELALFDVPAGVEVAPMRGPSGDLLFLLNHTDVQQVVDLGPGEWHDHVGGVGGDRVTLAPRGLALAERGAQGPSAQPSVEASATEQP
jgi:beta-galactosidase